MVRQWLNRSRAVSAGAAASILSPAICFLQCLPAASIHVSHLDYTYRHDTPLYNSPPADRNGEADAAIGKWIAEHLVEDGATLQMGIGGIPDQVLANLGGHKDLGG